MIKKVLVLRSVDDSSVVGTVRISVDDSVRVEYSPNVPNSRCLLLYNDVIYDENNYMDIPDFSSVVAMIVRDTILYISSTNLSISRLNDIYATYLDSISSPPSSVDIEEDTSTTEPTNIDSVHDKNDQLNFYYKIRDALEEMYVCYPEEKTLCSLIEGSQWVRIDSGRGYYVVGKMYIEGVLKYICYGLPGDKSMSPPDELANHTQYIPVPNSNGGYFVVFQDANTGELLKNSD